MKMTKFGHSCLLIEENGVRVLFDPGSYSTGQNELKNIDAVLITHEHGDHCDIGSLKIILENNPEAQVISNANVCILLQKENISCEIMQNGDSKDVKGISIKVFGRDHALLHSSIPPFANIGFRITKRFSYAGDSFAEPTGTVEILALPLVGSWMKLSETLDYALKLKPKVCFPVHDAIIKEPEKGYALVAKILEPAGIKFVPLEIGKEYEF